MGESINYSEALFEAIDKIVDQKLNQVKFDRTVACEVVKVFANENKYWVNCEGLRLEVSSIDEKVTYKVGDIVYVLIPEGSYEKVKVIIGGYNTQTEQQRKKYVNQFDRLVSGQTIKVIDESNSLKLDLNPENSVPITEAISKPQDVEQLKYTRENNYQYDYVGIKWKINTLACFEKINNGAYQLELAFFQKSQEDTNISIKDLNEEDMAVYMIKSSDIFGNPYALTDTLEQTNIFKYEEKLKDCNAVSIRLQHNEEYSISNIDTELETETQPSLTIELTNLEIFFGIDKNKYIDNALIYLENDQSINYNNLNDKTKELDRTIYLDWRHNEKIFNYINLPKISDFYNLRIYLLQYHENFGIESELVQYGITIGIQNWKIYNMSKNSICIQEGTEQKDITIEEIQGCFSHEITLDSRYQTNQFKFVIVYQDGKEENWQYEFSTPLIFESYTEGLILPPNGAIRDNLKLTFTDAFGNFVQDGGQHRSYDFFGKAINGISGQEYYIKAEFIDGFGLDKIQNQLGAIEWVFPTTNTMLIDTRLDNTGNFDSDWEKKTKEERLIIPYKISSYYSPSKTNNTIHCRILLITGEERTGSITVSFGQVGNTGTNYAFNLEYVDKEEPYLSSYYKDGNVTIDPKAITFSLLDENGDEVPKENYINNLNFSWVFPNKEKTNNLLNKEKTESIVSVNDIKCEWSADKEDELILSASLISVKNYSILKAEIKDYYTADKKLNFVTYLPIVMNRATQEQKPLFITGPTLVVYDALGTNAVYDTNMYNVYKNDKQVISDITWILDINKDLGTKYGFPKLKNEQGKYSLEPADYTPSDIPAVCLRAIKGNDEIVWSQPIVILQNTWLNSLVNEWDGKVEVNSEKGHITSPIFIAGEKNSNNQLTGVLMGKVKLDNNTTSSGIYGFKDGQGRFWLNNKAEFYVGSGTEKHISFNKEGELEIAAKSFKLEAGNSNNYLYLGTSENKNNYNFVLGNNLFTFRINDAEATIAGWKIDKDAIYKPCVSLWDCAGIGFKNSILPAIWAGYYGSGPSGNKIYKSPYDEYEKTNGSDSWKRQTHFYVTPWGSFHVGGSNDYIHYEYTYPSGINNYLEIKTHRFTLTTPNLNIESQDGNGVSIFNSQNQLRIKLGKIIKNGGNTYGLDIYQGAIRMYGIPYSSDLTDNDATLWFDTSNGRTLMHLKAEFKNSITFEDDKKDSGYYIHNREITLGSSGHEKTWYKISDQSSGTVIFRGMSFKPSQIYNGETKTITDLGELYLGFQEAIHNREGYKSYEFHNMGLYNFGTMLSILNFSKENNQDAMSSLWLRANSLDQQFGEGTDGADIFLEHAAVHCSNTITLSTRFNHNEGQVFGAQIILKTVATDQSYKFRKESSITISATDFTVKNDEGKQYIKCTKSNKDEITIGSKDIEEVLLDSAYARIKLYQYINGENYISFYLWDNSEQEYKEVAYLGKNGWWP